MGEQHQDGGSVPGQRIEHARQHVLGRADGHVCEDTGGFELSTQLGVQDGGDSDGVVTGSHQAAGDRRAGQVVAVEQSKVGRQQMRTGWSSRRVRRTAVLGLSL